MSFHVERRGSFRDNGDGRNGVPMLLTPLAVKDAVAHGAGGAIGPGLGVLAALAAAGADAAGAQPLTGVLTIIASVLGATGVIGWGFRAWLTAQLARSEEQRKLAATERAEEREEDRLERERQRLESEALMQRYFDDRREREAYLLAQIEMWRQRADAERERSDRIIMQFITIQPAEDAL